MTSRRDWTRWAAAVRYAEAGGVFIGEQPAATMAVVRSTVGR